MATSSSAPRSMSLRVPNANASKSSQSAQQQADGRANPSNIALFLTNLRLLDLDLLDDWPDITALTFSTKDAQKKRVQCVEWALYQLFAIWDPEETRNRLSPYFPPLEPLQSLNLRSALFRCLEQVKKTGLLGRDAVLRKTMLDECKGERLEELLAVFSTAVLKMLETSRQQDGAIAQKISMEQLSYSGDRTPISTLILAHKVSLSRILTAKNIAKSNYDDFSSLLKLKNRQIARRHEQLKALVEENKFCDEISNEESKSLQGRARGNWTRGNEWLEAILCGDNGHERDGLLTRSFDDVWEHVENASVGDIEDNSRKGLVDELDARIRDQNNRLEKWRGFERALMKGGSPGLGTKPSELGKTMKGIDFGFGAHETLQLHSSPKKAGRATLQAPLEEYTRLWGKLQADLANVGKPRNSKTDAKRNEMTMDKESLLSPAFEPLKNSLYDSLTATSGIDSERNSTRFGDYIKHTSQTPQLEHVPVCSDSVAAKNLEPSGDDNDSIELNSFAVPVTRSPPPSPSFDASLEASDILAAVQTSSPSPTKPRHVLSLAERTRLSMSRVSLKTNPYSQSRDLDSMSEMLPVPESLKARTQILQSQATSSSTHSDLSARTRQSLFNSTAVQKTVELERRRSLKAAERAKRASHLPPKPLETTFEAPDSNTVNLDRMKLIEEAQDADYEAVFKSRPKIKTSPGISPEMARLSVRSLENRSSSPAPASP